MSNSEPPYNGVYTVCS